MGFCSELHAEIFSEPSADSEYVKWLEQEHQKMEREREALYREEQREARPIDLKEKERLVKGKSARVAQKLGAAKSDQLKNGMTGGSDNE